MYTDSLTVKLILPNGHEFMKIQYKPGRMANQKYQNIAHHDCRQAVFRSGVIFLLLGFAHFHRRRWSNSNGSGLGTITFTWWGHCRGRYCIRSRSFNFYVVTRGKLIVFCKKKEIVVYNLSVAKYQNLKPGTMYEPVVTMASGFLLSKQQVCWHSGHFEQESPHEEHGDPWPLDDSEDVASFVLLVWCWPPLAPSTFDGLLIWGWVWSNLFPDSKGQGSSCKGQFFQYPGSICQKRPIYVNLLTA